MKRYWILIVAAAGAASTVTAQSTQFRQIFTSDSIISSSAQTSADDKWIVMSRSEGSVSASLWIAPMSGGSPIRLTSSGHNDVQPVWFSASDRIVFASTRPNRNGGQQQFLMTLEIDPATGRAKGAPRQVTSEPVEERARSLPSPDGKSILYITPGQQQPQQLLRIVPSNGGSARTVVQLTTPFAGLTFSRDGRHAYYTQQAGIGGRWCRPDGWSCTSYTIKRVAIDGGTPVDVATESHRIRVLAADPRYVQHQVSTPSRTSGGGIWELRDSTGRALGRIEFPDGVNNAAFTGDGWGLVGIMRQEDLSIRLVSVPDGAMRTVTTTGRRWPEAWMPDGSAIITDRHENGRIVVEVTSLDGKPLSQHSLPANAQSSGWNSSVGPWFSYQPGPLGLSALNVVTGETKQISTTGTCCGGGRGGMDQDGGNWGYWERNENQIVRKSTDPATGVTVTLRTFTTSSQRGQTIAAGSRVAWIEARGDSIDLMVSENVSGPARKVLSSRGTLRDAGENIAFSWKGDRIAVCGGATGLPGTLTILNVPMSASGPVTRQDIPLSSATGCWGPQWQPDDSGLVLIVIMNRPENPPDLAYMSLRSGAQLKVLTAEDPYALWNYITSPDGKYVTYAVNLPVSRASIHVASFKPLIDGKR